MKVLKRSQITEIVTRRLVFHELEVDGVKYSRIVKTKIYIPYLDTNVVISEPKTTWEVYVNENTTQKLKKKEVYDLNLETLFDELSINEKNGNG